MTVVADLDRSEVILPAKVQFPEGKPCINEFGQRIQAFAGCAEGGRRRCQDGHLLRVSGGRRDRAGV